MTIKEENKLLKKYIQYIQKYAEEHEIEGNYPVCYDEWIDNENEEETN